MTIAYMGSEPWNDDVMIEVGFRLASGLPLVVICDAPRDGQPFHLPMIINDLTHLQIPPPGAPDDPTQIDELLDLIQDAEQRCSRIDSHHPIALVHYYKARAAGMVDADEMHYIAASDLATELFGIKADNSDEYSLVGHTMKDFLDHLEYRMPRQHYEVFRLSQQSARQTLSERLRTNFPLPPAVEVPIVLNRHPNPDHIGRAFLPVIVSKYVSDDKAWCNLRVLYLEVTSQTEGKVPPDPIPPEGAVPPIPSPRRWRTAGTSFARSPAATGSRSSPQIASRSACSSRTTAPTGIRSSSSGPGWSTSARPSTPGSIATRSRGPKTLMRDSRRGSPGPRWP